MSPSARKPSASVNLTLVLAASLLVGFIGGYLFGLGGPIAAVTTQAVARGCPHDLDPADQYIIAGFQCPNPADMRPLQDCHCDLAHQIKDWVKEELSKGKDGPEIRRALEERYGARLKPLGSE